MTGPAAAGGGGAAAFGLAARTAEGDGHASHASRTSPAATPRPLATVVPDGASAGAAASLAGGTGRRTGVWSSSSPHRGQRILAPRMGNPQEPQGGSTVLGLA